MAEGELDLSAVVSKLMNDKNVAELIENIKSNAENVKNDVGNDEGLKTGGPVQGSEFDNVGNVMPADILEKLPQVMSAIAPLMKSGTLKGRGQTAETDTRNKLLVALKPYLNESRCGMIDSIMALSKLTGIMDILPGGNK